MKIAITFSDHDAQAVLYFLRHHYNSNAGLPRLIKKAIWNVVAEQAAKEAKDAEATIAEKGE